MLSESNKRYLCWWLAAVMLFILLGSLSLSFEIYQRFPAIGFIGYPVLLLLLLTALSKAQEKWHYITIGATLIIFGAIASLDIVLSRESIIQALLEMDSAVVQELLPNPERSESYVNVLVILLNVFTSSVAGNALFYGLNARSFH
ncbi:hypothetical protein [uncultured Endozoicomonas sp.]|uniref:hypothetical protein n=1 Tax=uncultured Endozoicomonas sp. TaxID=432652 RepID=UPI0026131915|nr:hypothetical protein [uncultured Endozoicomonas sp.]